MTGGDEVQRMLSDLEAASPEDRHVFIERIQSIFPVHELEGEWGVPAKVILEAISRSSDLSQRGVRGLIAEAYFEIDVVPKLKGWTHDDESADEDFDYLLCQGDTKVKVEVKQQRSEKGSAAIYKSTGMFKVETQKTRTGKKQGKKTRPYRVGDFDLLAVNMRASCGDWTRFLFVPASALLVKPDAEDEFQTMQPVPPEPDEYWSDDINVALKRLVEGVEGTINETVDGLF